MTPNYIKKLRERMDMTQEQFAHAIGAGRVSVARWETGAAKPMAVYVRIVKQFEQQHAAKTTKAKRKRK